MALSFAAFCIAAMACAILSLHAQEASKAREVERAAVDAVDRAVAYAEPYLERWGYAAVFGTMAAEAICIPAPGHTMVVAAAILAGRGKLNIWLVAAASVAGTVIGSQAGWLIGRFGSEFVRRRGGFVADRLEKIDRFFQRWGTAAIVASPFIEGLRQIAAIAAGLLAMPWLRFTLCNIAGALLWVAVWGGVTWWLAEDMAGVLALADRLRPWLLEITAALVVIGLAAFFLRRRPRA